VGEGFVSSCADGRQTECVACKDGEYSEGGLGVCQSCGNNEVSNEGSVPIFLLLVFLPSFFPSFVISTATTITFTTTTTITIAITTITTTTTTTTKVRSACLLCKACAGGEGIISPCDASSGTDTVCAPCEQVLTGTGLTVLIFLTGTVLTVLIFLTGTVLTVLIFLTGTVLTVLILRM
jgi:hypothetical protein